MLFFEIALHLTGSNLTIQQTISAINHMFIPEQSSLPAGIHVFIRQNSIVIRDEHTTRFSVLSCPVLSCSQPPSCWVAGQDEK
jgi:hypothetical protein